MTSTSPSSPVATSETMTSTLGNQKLTTEFFATNSSDNDDSTKLLDTWAFLEKELEEFKRVVAELEEIKFENSKKDTRSPPESGSHSRQHKSETMVTKIITSTKIIDSDLENSTVIQNDPKDVGGKGTSRRVKFVAEEYETLNEHIADVVGGQNLTVVKLSETSKEVPLPISEIRSKSPTQLKVIPELASPESTLNKGDFSKIRMQKKQKPVPPPKPDIQTISKLSSNQNPSKEGATTYLTTKGVHPSIKGVQRDSRKIGTPPYTTV